MNKGFCFCLEPIRLVGDADYNLNILKEVSTTEEFLALSMEKRGCQELLDFQSCLTDSFVNSLKKNCNCLPFNEVTKNKGNKKYAYRI